MRDRKNENRKKGKNKFQHLDFVFSVTYGCSHHVYKMTLSKKETKKSVKEIFIREKEKWTNKRTDKQYVADSLIHSTTVHYQALYQISRS